MGGLNAFSLKKFRDGDKIVTTGFEDGDGAVYGFYAVQVAFAAMKKINYAVLSAGKHFFKQGAGGIFGNPVFAGVAADEGAGYGLVH